MLQQAKTSPRPSPKPSPSLRDLFTPKLVTVLREGYGLPQLRADALAGLTVAIVALPLSMAIAIACGVSPDKGLATAIIGGFLISAFGGSRFQIGGPAGAFIVLVAATIERHGYDGFLLATMIAGLVLVLIGFLRLGTYIKYIPHPVTVGFSAGIAVIILASQFKELLGLTLVGPEPAALLPKVEALWQVRETANGATIALAVASIGLIILVRRIDARLPAFLIVVLAATLASWAFGLPVETIGSRFGEVPRGLPAPSMPALSLDKVLTVLPDALALALLGGIESLLSAVVADGMTGRRHRSNCELVAQGLANIASPLFGGLTATGTIARTATNVRAGAIGPVSGMLHALFLLVFMLVAAPLAAYVPLAALGAVLAVVAWNMAERHAFASILTRSRGEAVVLLATFLLTVFRDLTEGIAVGVVLGSFLFMHRMGELVAVERHASLGMEDEADAPAGAREAYDSGRVADPDVIVYSIAGPLFFAAAGNVGAILERIGSRPKTLVLDLSQVPFADSTAARALLSIARETTRRGARLYIAGASPSVRRVLAHEGLKVPLVRYAATVAAARDAAGRALATL
ncbi:SulP family inorganic anion transporter [Chelatococcus daeguensis]|uniref:SulP family inorganic anion transporter n=1 Tax=Chelatococcus daeguensis TaxID=444444 RepID=UPI0007ABAF68|nr:SulP family inorganic anion transporter [Chelatococcus daeguensis]KZE35376.1 SulP family sulfate transporter [Chelatococcus daeguensis]MBM3085358.1 SulP family inorganic anion transporter [Chelatococcus daeguensis]